MTTFTQTFKTVEKNINSQITNLGFKLSDLYISETPNNMIVFASANYIENSRRLSFKRNVKFIRLSTAPLRLELDLDFGWGESKFSIYELYELEGDFKFPERENDLYEAMYEVKQLQFEFERLIKVFQLCGKRFLSNDKSLKNDLKNQRANKSVSLENEELLNKAEKAFKDHLWDEVVSLLGAKEKYLSALNRKRLQYAKRMAQRIN